MVRFELIHAVGLIISVLLVTKSVGLVRKRKENIYEFLLWVSFGLSLFVVTVSSIFEYYNLIELLLVSFGYERGKVGLPIIGILGLLVLVFYTYTNVKSNREEISDLNRQIALLEYELEKERDDGETEDESSNT